VQVASVNEVVEGWKRIIMKTEQQPYRTVTSIVPCDHALLFHVFVVAVIFSPMIYERK